MLLVLYAESQTCMPVWLWLTSLHLCHTNKPAVKSSVHYLQRLNWGGVVWGSAPAHRLLFFVIRWHLISHIYNNVYIFTLFSANTFCLAVMNTGLNEVTYELANIRTFTGFPYFLSMVFLKSYPADQRLQSLVSQSDSTDRRLKGGWQVREKNRSQTGKFNKRM